MNIAEYFVLIITYWNQYGKTVLAGYNRTVSHVNRQGVWVSEQDLPQIMSQESQGWVRRSERLTQSWDAANNLWMLGEEESFCQRFCSWEAIHTPVLGVSRNVINLFLRNSLVRQRKQCLKQHWAPKPASGDMYINTFLPVNSKMISFLWYHLKLGLGNYSWNTLQSLRIWLSGDYYTAGSR